MKWIRSSVVFMALLAGILVIGSLVMGYNPEYRFYIRPEFLIIPVVLLVIQVACLLQYRFHWRKLGFYICHIGVVILIVGAFVSYFTIQETNFQIPVNQNAMYDSIQKNDGTEIKFDFQISVNDFVVEREAAEYQVYAPDETVDTGYSLLKERVALNRKGYYEIGGGYQDVKEEQVKDGKEFKSEVSTDDGLLLTRLPQNDKSYQVKLRFYGDEIKDETLALNHPVIHEGWKFYLMDYDRQAQNYVTLFVKKDAGNLLIRIGIWMLLTGTILMCFRVLEKRGEN